eukprot:c23974_g1_i1 orf=440-859(-)
MTISFHTIPHLEMYFIFVLLSAAPLLLHMDHIDHMQGPPSQNDRQSNCSFTASREQFIACWPWHILQLSHSSEGNSSGTYCGFTRAPHLAYISRRALPRMISSLSGLIANLIPHITTGLQEAKQWSLHPREIRPPIGLS